MDRALAKLLVSAGILSTWEQRTWFGDCWLKGPILCVPSEELASSIRRCYLPKIQAAWSDCEVRVMAAKPEPVKAVYKGQNLEPVKQRLLD